MWMMNYLRWMMVVFAIVSVSGCGLLTPKIVDTSCDWTFTMRPEASDVRVVSDSLARQIVTHNERRAVVCP